MGQHDAATEPLAELAGKPVILVVEDELLVRIVQVDILREAGFRVAEAQDADEAFDMLRRRPEIAAVLTDVDMPGSLNGFEFARLVKQGWPEVGRRILRRETCLRVSRLCKNRSEIRPSLSGSASWWLRRCRSGDDLRLGKNSMQ